MKIFLSLVLACATLGAFGATIEDELPNLLALCNDEEFDVREHATMRMAEFPAEYADKFLNMAKNEKCPEVQYRLKAAAYGVFAHKIGCKDDRWLYFHGTLFLNGQVMWTTSKVDTNAPYWHSACQVSGLLVTWVNEMEGPCKGKIQQSDLIISIEGGVNPINVKAGCEYTIHIRRYKSDKSVRYIEDHNSIDPEATEKDYDEFDVKVTAAWQERRFINELAEFDLMQKLWQEFLDLRKQ